MRGSLATGLFAAALMTAPAAPTVTFDWIAIGDLGNAADPETGYGAVVYAYEISRTEVTNAQYAEFLNAVAATDTYGVYNTEMGSSAMGGIDRSGAPGSYSYSVKPGFADEPVNFVGFWDVVRFANWLQNGQPSGLQDASTTEDGAYTLTASGIANNTVTRNPGATIFVTSEDEWYKAAYYDALSTTWYDFPTGTDVTVVCAAPGATPNTASCEKAVDDLVDVGLYTGAEAPSGTFDQAGNIWEWNDAIQASLRGVRGGGFGDSAAYIAASSRSFGVADHEIPNVGFRIAQLPDCSNGLDDDGDGRIDMDDPGCDSAADVDERSPLLACDDGADNDGDGRSDFDPVTHDDPAAGAGDPGCSGPVSREDPECQDGIDNDGQPGTDFDGGLSAGGAGDPNGADPECVAPWNAREAGRRRCGLGFELAFLLPLLRRPWRADSNHKRASRSGNSLYDNSPGFSGS